MANYGVTHLHHFFLPRARQALNGLWTRAHHVPSPRLRAFLLFAVEQAIWTMSILDRYRPTGYSQVNQYLTAHLSLKCRPVWENEVSSGHEQGAYRTQ